MKTVLAIAKKEYLNTDIKRSLINNIPFFIFFTINAVFQLGSIKQDMGMEDSSLTYIVEMINGSAQLSVSFTYKLFMSGFVLPSVVYYFIKAFPYIINSFQKDKEENVMSVLLLAPIKVTHIVFGGSLFATLYIFLISLLGMIPIILVYIFLGFHFTSVQIIRMLVLFVALCCCLLALNILTNTLVWVTNRNPIFIQCLRFVVLGVYLFSFYKLNTMDMQLIFNNVFIAASFIGLIVVVFLVDLLLRRFDKDKLMTGISKETI